MPLIDAVTIQAVMVQLDPCITDVHQIMTSVTMFFRVETSDGTSHSAKATNVAQIPLHDVSCDWFSGEQVQDSWMYN
jgi:hypothetical protein